jgi:hypothetical protein
MRISARDRRSHRKNKLILVGCLILVVSVLITTYFILNSPVHLLGWYSDSVFDIDGDRMYDSLNISTEVLISKPGCYTFGAILSANQPEPLRQDIDSTQVRICVDRGFAQVQLRFPGKYIRESGIDGPYLLSSLWVTDIDNPSPSELQSHLIAQRVEPYITSFYKSTQFQAQ